MTEAAIEHDKLARWMEYVTGDHNPASLMAMLAEDAVFHSPVVHTPQQGKAKTAAYLMAADSVFSDSKFRYVRTIAEGDHAMLEFTSEIDGIHINGVDIITWNADGLITDFKVMVRPLKAINKIWEMMAAQLEKQAG